MRSRRQCLEKAAHCERLAVNSTSPLSEHLLLETAKQWRNLATASRPRVSKSSAKAGPILDDQMVASLLSKVVCPLR